VGDSMKGLEWRCVAYKDGKDSRQLRQMHGWLRSFEALATHDLGMPIVVLMSVSYHHSRHASRVWSGPNSEPRLFPRPVIGSLLVHKSDCK
jgi:hypothetical protein